MYLYRGRPSQVIGDFPENVEETETKLLTSLTVV